MATAMLADGVEGDAEAREVPEPAQEQGEEAIVAALSRGDARQAIARCARVYGAPLGRFCHALLANASEADEAVQETLLVAYDAAADFRGEGSVRGWLYGIARRICARRLEIRTRQARRRTLITEGEPQTAVDDALDQARRGATVRAALAELRPTEREALLLRYEGDLSYRDVAAACGIDEAAARQRVSRALAKVRARVSGRGMDQ